MGEVASVAKKKNVPNMFSSEVSILLHQQFGAVAFWPMMASSSQSQGQTLNNFWAVTSVWEAVGIPKWWKLNDIDTR